MRLYSPIYFVLSGCRLLNDEGEALSQDELMKLWGLYNMMVGSTLSTFILRGESDENLRSQFGTNTENPALLAKYLFMVGEKGRTCWTDKEFLNPDDVSEESFRNSSELPRTNYLAVDEIVNSNKKLQSRYGETIYK